MGDPVPVAPAGSVTEVPAALTGRPSIAGVSPDGEVFIDGARFKDGVFTLSAEQREAIRVAPLGQWYLADDLTWVRVVERPSRIDR